ncbi:hypothetical protein HDU76_013470 [Blyttiomyces sp. JEL0837]|nr:hypothetical protein HDU76_013470 [Blyttiomyces sp. JEL0837]
MAADDITTPTPTPTPRNDFDASQGGNSQTDAAHILLYTASSIIVLLWIIQCFCPFCKRNRFNPEQQRRRDEAIRLHNLRLRDRNLEHQLEDLPKYEPPAGTTTVVAVQVDGQQQQQSDHGDGNVHANADGGNGSDHNNDTLTVAPPDYRPPSASAERKD